MKGYVVTSLALAVLLGAGVLADEKKADKEEVAKKDWKLLNGTWEAVRAVKDGKEQPSKGKATMTFKDGKYTVKVGDKVAGEGTFNLDPTATPKSLDITPSSGPDKGKTGLAIYEVKEDSLRLCWAPGGKSRPKAFESKEGSGLFLVTFKRVKPKD
jgi:uncharacterized protein (TIGR03067 family)